MNARDCEHGQLRRSCDRCEDAETIKRLTEAIRWALGENGAFRARGVDEGPYWWRTELRLRAAIEKARKA